MLRNKSKIYLSLRDAFLSWYKNFAKEVGIECLFSKTLTSDYV